MWNCWKTKTGNNTEKLLRNRLFYNSSWQLNTHTTFKSNCFKFSWIQNSFDFKHFQNLFISTRKHSHIRINSKLKRITNKGQPEISNLDKSEPLGEFKFIQVANGVIVFFRVGRPSKLGLCYSLAINHGCGLWWQ